MISVTKGIEQESLKRMTEIVLDETGRSPETVGVLTGPNSPGRSPTASRRPLWWP